MIGLINIDHYYRAFFWLSQPSPALIYNRTTWSLIHYFAQFELCIPRPAVSCPCSLRVTGVPSWTAASGADSYSRPLEKLTKRWADGHGRTDSLGQWQCTYCAWCGVVWCVSFVHIGPAQIDHIMDFTQHQSSYYLSFLVVSDHNCWPIRLYISACCCNAAVVLNINICFVIT